MPHAVLGFDRGRHSTKAHLVLDGQEFTYCAPSLAVTEPIGADPDGDPLERLLVDERAYLVGRRALATSPDAIFRTTGSKTEGEAAHEFRLSFMAVLAWACSKVDLERTRLLVVTSAPDSEWERAKEGLKAILTDSFQFQTGDGRFRRLDTTSDRVTVARESIAPFWAHAFDVTGAPRPAEDNPFMWAVGGRRGSERAIEARALTLGIGFRDWNVAQTFHGKRIESRSGIRGVSEVYAALYDAINGLDIGFSLRSRADVDSVLSGDHPIWVHRDPEKLEGILLQVVRQKGASILSEAIQWAGSPDEYHAVLAAGGGSLLLRDLVESQFPKAVFAAQGDSAKGLAYAGVRALNARHDKG